MGTFWPSRTWTMSPSGTNLTLGTGPLFSSYPRKRVPRAANSLPTVPGPPLSRGRRRRETGIICLVHSSTEPDHRSHPVEGQPLENLPGNLLSRVAVLGVINHGLHGHTRSFYDPDARHHTRRPLSIRAFDQSIS